MFFKSKKQEGSLDKLQERLNSLEQWMKEAAQRQDDFHHSFHQELDDHLEQHFDQIRSSIQKHDMSIEDLLDELEDWRSEEKETREQIRGLKQTEDRLLELFGAYQEQFFQLQRFAAGKDAGWSEQLALIEKNLENFRRSCGIHVIHEKDVMADTALHEVIKTIDTNDPDRDKTVAEVYLCGYLYKGQVKKKAQVAAYRTM